MTPASTADARFACVPGMLPRARSAASLVVLSAIVAACTSGDDGGLASTDASVTPEVSIEVGPGADAAVEIGADAGSDATDEPEASDASDASDAAIEAADEPDVAVDASDDSDESDASDAADEPDVAMDASDESDASDAAIEAADEPDVAMDAADEGDASDASDAPVEADASTVPTPLAQGFGRVTAVVADATTFYFATFGTSPGGVYATDGKVIACPLQGGCAVSQSELATGLNQPAFLAIDGANLFIGEQGSYGSGTSDGYVDQCPIAGCGAGNVDRIALSPGLQNMGGLAVRAGWVYFVHNPLTQTCGRAPVGGGQVQWLGDATGYASVSPTVDDANVYWAHSYYPPAIHYGALDGGSHGVLVDLPSVNGGTGPRGLIADGGFIYYVATNEGLLQRVGADGTGMTTFASGFSAPYWTTMDASSIWVVDYNYPNAIHRVSKATAAVTSFDTMTSVTGIAVNDTLVLWSTYDGAVWARAK